MCRKPLPLLASPKVWLCCVLAMGLAAARENTVSSAEAQDGWLLLFDGESLFGWSQQGAGHWRIADGKLLYDGVEDSALRTGAPFSDFTLKFDFRGRDPARFGSVFLRTSKDGAPKDSGYLLQLGTDDPKWPAGSIVPVKKSDGSELASDQWHVAEVEAAGEHLVCKLDGKTVADGKDSKSAAGYIALGGRAGSRMEFRNVKLKPQRTKSLFSGTDLAGWKAVNPAPKSGGVLKKLLKQGGKSNEAAWTILAGAIHSEHGPGQLETKATYDDFLLQISVRTNTNKKNEHGKTAIFVRGDPGQFSTGYAAEIALPGGAGGLAGLKSPRRALGIENQFVTETIAARGRHFEIWVDGFPVTEYDDPRPESSSPLKGARTAAGALSLQAPVADASIDFRNVKVATLPKIFGGDMNAVAAAPVPVASPVAATAQAPAANTTFQPQTPASLPPAMAQMQERQAEDKAKQAQVSKLMSQALNTSDPRQQEQLYAKILTLDPNNMVAAQGHKDAEQKIEAAAAEKQKKAEQNEKKTEEQTNKEATVSQALQNGEAAFLAGKLDSANGQLAIAEKLAPANPLVQNFRARVNVAIQSRNRVRALASGAGAAALIGALILAFRKRGKKRPFLEVIAGLEKGKRFGLDQEVSHIGAVAQDGGDKNEIVVKDIERMVSRFHCEVHNKEGRLFLIDRNSANGTRLNGKRLRPGMPARLKNGARVELARACALRLGYEK